MPVGLYGLDDPGYLVQMYGAFRSSSAPDCTAIPELPISTDGEPFPGFVPGMPTWVEASRLASGEPIPLATAGSLFHHNLEYMAGELYPPDGQTIVTFIGEDGQFWAFDATYAELGGVPPYPAGFFVTLTYNRACSSASQDGGQAEVPAGEYAVRSTTTLPAGTGGGTNVRDIGVITVIAGTPPERLLDIDPAVAEATSTLEPWSPEPYVPSDAADLPQLGEDGYLSPVNAVAHVAGRVGCAFTSSVEAPAPDTDSGFPSPVRSWLGWELLYSSDRTLLYSADEPDYAAVSAAYLNRYSDEKTHVLSLINSDGGFWGYGVHVYENNGSAAGAPGIYVWYSFDESCGGGNRSYGGPLPAGIYEARLLSMSKGAAGDSDVVYLGPVEVMP